MRLVGLSSAGLIAAAVRDGELSAEAVCADALAGAEAAPGIFWAVDPDARAAAAAIDRRVAAGEPVGSLAGVPVAVKDNFDVAGLPSSLGIRPDFSRPARDAVAVRRLREAGAIVIGKTAMDQLAWSMDGTAPGFPALENPRRPGRIAGGSSGGSAAAVAAGIVPIALGTDTAGSVRVPADWCETVALKLGPGVASLAGCAPLAPSYDSLGVLARSVADCALAFAVLAPEAAAPRPSEAFVARRWGTPDEEALAASWERSATALGNAGWELGPLDAPLAAPGFGRALAAEFAAAWGERLADETLEPDVRAGIEHGAAVDPGRLAAARAGLAAAGEELRAALAPADVLLTPTAPVGPPPLGEAAEVGVASRFTRPLSAFGWPAVSLPLAAVPGLGEGALQIAAPPGGEATVLAAAAAAERALVVPEGRA